ncbi:MAG: hypothetical protein MHM6MM_000054 [Cercozoa sp. M6MM]
MSGIIGEARSRSRSELLEKRKNNAREIAVKAVDLLSQKRREALLAYDPQNETRRISEDLKRRTAQKPREVLSRFPPKRKEPVVHERKMLPKTTASLRELTELRVHELRVEELKSLAQARETIIRRTAEKAAHTHANATVRDTLQQQPSLDTDTQSKLKKRRLLELREHANDLFDAACANRPDMLLRDRFAPSPILPNAEPVFLVSGGIESDEIGTEVAEQPKHSSHRRYDYFKRHFNTEPSVWKGGNQGVDEPATRDACDMPETTLSGKSVFVKGRRAASTSQTEEHPRMRRRLNLKEAAAALGVEENDLVVEMPGLAAHVPQFRAETAPLYSSFTPDFVFREPQLPPLERYAPDYQRKKKRRNLYLEMRRSALRQLRSRAALPVQIGFFPTRRRASNLGARVRVVDQTPTADLSEHTRSARTRTGTSSDARPSTNATVSTRAPATREVPLPDVASNEDKYNARDVVRTKNWRRLPQRPSSGSQTQVLLRRMTPAYVDPNAVMVGHSICYSTCIVSSLTYRQVVRAESTTSGAQTRLHRSNSNSSDCGCCACIPAQPVQNHRT